MVNDFGYFRSIWESFKELIYDIPMMIVIIAFLIGSLLLNTFFGIGAYILRIFCSVTFAIVIIGLLKQLIKKESFDFVLAIRQGALYVLRAAGVFAIYLLVIGVFYYILNLLKASSIMFSQYAGTFFGILLFIVLILTFIAAAIGFFYFLLSVMLILPILYVDGKGIWYTFKRSITYIWLHKENGLKLLGVFVLGQIIVSIPAAIYYYANGVNLEIAALHPLFYVSMGFLTSLLPTLFFYTIILYLAKHYRASQ